jgi:hypothetical protein
MRLALILAVLVLLSGCETARRIIGKPEPVPADCPKECFVPCGKLVPLPRWTDGTCDQLKAAYEMDAVICGKPVMRDGKLEPSVNDAILQACEKRGDACVLCIENLRKNGVIK